MESAKKLNVNQRIANEEDLATELYINLALGRELPDHLKTLKPNLMLLRDMVKKIGVKTDDLIDIPFELGELETLKDMMFLSSKVIKSYASGEMGAKAAEQMFSFIRGHRKMIESVEVMAMIEQLKADQSKLLGMEKTSSGATEIYTPILIDNENHTETVVPEDIKIHGSRQPIGREVVFSDGS